MERNEYLNWLSKETDSEWCNDSAIIEEIQSALNSGATGCTSNPPLTYQSLIHNPELFKSEVEKIPKNIAGNARVEELLGIVVRTISKILFKIYEVSDGQKGYIRTQVQPSLFSDAKAMLEMGSRFAAWGKNVMVKIPGTAAGVWVLEELAAMGIPTTPTVCVSASQIIAVAQGYERGIKRAEKAGIKPMPSTAAFVMGRLEDYLASLNQERNTGLSKYDLDCAVLAVAKRCYKTFVERGYKQLLMPAAFRSSSQVAQLAGGKVVMTIHPTIQAQVLQDDKAGIIRREVSIDNPVDPDAVERVSKVLPEFVQAYKLDGIEMNDFEKFGATKMTLDGFDVTGWQKLLTL